MNLANGQARGHLKAILRSHFATWDVSPTPSEVDDFSQGCVWRYVKAARAHSPVPTTAPNSASHTRVTAARSLLCTGVPFCPKEQRGKIEGETVAVGGLGYPLTESGVRNEPQDEHRVPQLHPQTLSSWR